MKILRLAPTASVTTTSAGVLIRSDLATYALRGPDARAFVEQVLPLLDGTLDLIGIQGNLPSYSPSSLAAILRLLEERGLVEEAPGRSGQDTYFRVMGGDPRRLAEARVLVAGDAPWLDVAAAELRAAGVGAVDQAAEGSMMGRLLLAAGGDREEEGRWARAAHAAGLPSLWGQANGGTLVLGPLTVPGQTACRVCAAAETVNPGVLSRPPGDAAPGAEALLGHLAALEAIKVVSRQSVSRLGGRVMVEEIGGWESEMAAVARLPWCPVCG